MQAVKFVDGSDNVIEGPLAPFHGPSYMKGKDTDGEFFDEKTDFMLDWFGDWERPLLFAHGFDDAIKTSIVGRIKVEARDKSLWMQAQLDKNHEYHAEISELIAKDALGFSSGAVDHLALREPGGHIKSWPLVEGSLVPNPSNPEAFPHHTVKSADLSVKLPEGVESPPSDPISDEKEPTVAVKVSNEQVSLVIAAIKSDLTPQSLHDAAVTSGAKCASEAHPKPPVLKLAVAGTKAEKPTVKVDLEALTAEMRELAVKEVKSLLE